MSSSNGDLRQRKPATNGKASSKTSANVEIEDYNSRVISPLDILRVLLTLLALTLAASYYVTSGESFIFGVPRPWWTKPARIQSYLAGPVQLTPEQLLAYDGTDPSKPIYLAINGTIFDVSISPHTYGPGGSYHNFAGHDASRGYVTGCFAEDRTPDLRGVEDMYLAIEDDPDEQISSGARKTRAEQEKRLAKKKVQEEVDKWVNFYRNSQKYFEAGKVIGVKIDGEPPKLCESAEKGRPKRSVINKNKQDKSAKKPSSPGKPVQ